MKKNFCREGNVASEEDIKKSNEKNWDKENYVEKKDETDTIMMKINYYEYISTHKHYKYILMILIVISVFFAIVIGYRLGCKICGKKI